MIKGFFGMRVQMNTIIIDRNVVAKFTNATRRKIPLIETIIEGGAMRW